MYPPAGYTEEEPEDLLPWAGESEPLLPLPPPHIPQLVWSPRMVADGRERDRSDNRAAWDDILFGKVRMTNVKQPWASAILEFHKNYENRAAKLPDCGWVLIVASKGVGSRAEWDEAMASLRKKINADERTSGATKMQFLTKLDDMEPHDFPRGGIVGAMWVRDSIPPFGIRVEVGAPWRDMFRHAWEISKIIRFDTVIPLKGCQSTHRFYRTHKDRDTINEALLDQLELHDPSGTD